MKFLHTADLHIGKKLFELSLIEDQKYILGQITDIAVAKQVDAVVIAGDVYDRTVPSTEAVTLLNDFLTGLQKKGIPVIMISGNHDSPERVSFADAILEKQGLYIAGNYQQPLKTVVLEDEHGPVHFVCMPFVKPAVVDARARGAVDVPGEADYADTMERKEERVGEAEAEHQERGVRIQDSAAAVEHMLASQPMTMSLRQRYVLVTHYFVTGVQGETPELSDSETDINVGGLDSVPASYFQCFSYVALGHIHKPQNVNSGSERCKVAYSGSPLKYSFSEALGEKSVNVVELDETGVATVEKCPLKPLREMRCLKGKLADLMDSAVLEENQEIREDYLQVTLTDTEELIDPIGTLRSVYPNVLQLILEKNKSSEDGGYYSSMTLERKSTEELFAEFYEMLKGEPLDEYRKAVVSEVAEAVEVVL